MVADTTSGSEEHTNSLYPAFEADDFNEKEETAWDGSPLRADLEHVITAEPIEIADSPFEEPHHSLTTTSPPPTLEDGVRAARADIIKVGMDDAGMSEQPSTEAGQQPTLDTTVGDNANALNGIDGGLRVDSQQPEATPANVSRISSNVGGNAPDTSAESNHMTTAHALGDGLPANLHVRQKFLTRRVILIAALGVAFAFTSLIVILYLSATRQDEIQASQASLNAPISPTPSPSKEISVAVVQPPDMVYVPGGTYQMGRDDGDEYERPAHEVTVKPFYIDKYEVTCEQYAKFVDATGQPPPATWSGGRHAPELARKPVTGVNWVEANAYALWAGKRLPTEEEWEFAARGADGRRYPWGNEWRPDEVNAGSASRRFVEVGSYQGNASPFGAYDMVGNAWEWTASTMAAYPGGQLPSQPTGIRKVLRGGSWQSNQTQATTTYRFGWPAQGGDDYSNTGFRCVSSVEHQPQSGR
jgi:formylglycine-generating enzyme required for sulfatase activity